MRHVNQTCENCGHVGLESFIDKPSDAHLSLRCPECDLFQKGITPNNEVYEEEYHDEYNSRRVSKTTTALIRLSSIKKQLSEKHPWLLDIGCSVGATVTAATQLGWRATGVDVSQAAVRFCQANGLDCHQTDALELPFADNTFDVVSNWHVIEHVENVGETLREWRRVLKPGGIMVLETPNSRYLKARIMGPRYKKFWPPEHLYTFNRSNLSSLLHQAGFEVLPTRLIGGLTSLPLHLNSYALCYRGYRELCRSLNMCKSFEISCRKTQTPNVNVVFPNAA